MIRLTDPTRIGVALGEVRVMLGIGRRQLARMIAKETGRAENTLNAQLWTWDRGDREPAVSTLDFYLKALGYDLALVSRTEDPQRQMVLLAAIDNALRNGSHMTGANAALDLLCEELGVDRNKLTFDPAWLQATPD